MGTIFKRTKCKSCKRDLGREPKPAKGGPPPCRCGGEAYYLPNWYYATEVQLQTGIITDVMYSSKCTDRRVAELRLKELEDRKKAGTPFEKPMKVTLTEIAKEWLEWCDLRASQGLKPGKSTSKAYRCHMNTSIIPAIGNYQLQKIKEAIVDAFLASRIGATRKSGGKFRKNHGNKTISYNTIKNERACLSSFFTWCTDKRRGYIKDNPCKGAEIPMAIEKRAKKPPRFLSKEEVKALVSEISRTYISKNGKELALYRPHLRLIVLIGLNTGLRIEGILSLRWEELDFEQEVITKRVKGDKEIRFPFPQFLRAELMKWRQSQKIVSLSGWVIPSPVYPERCMGPNSDFGFETACKRTGLRDVTVHTLRHTWATHSLKAARNMADIKAISEILGHATPEITMRV